MPVLFYTIGYPGAGKTSFARSFSRWLGGLHLQADRIGIALFVTPTFSPAERVAVYQHMDYQAITALNDGKHVLYDGTINTLEQREHLRQTAQQHGTQAIGLWLTLPESIAMERAGRIRNVGAGGIGRRTVPPEVFRRHVAGFEKPTDHEAIIQISGLDHFSEQYQQAYAQLRSLGQALPRFIQL
jgi:predicted kinase